MSRGLDHIVHAVRDLDAVAELYRGLGFTVGRRNKLPREWGTQNHIVQTPDTFIELLAVTNPDDIVPHMPRQFSFGAFNRDFLKRGEGLSMLVLKGNGAPDAEEFRARGIGDFELYDFERQGKRPDGTSVKVAFSLAFANDNAADAGFFTCQQHYPENFWNPAFQVHANTAAAVAGVVLVAERPSDHRRFLSAFTSAHDVPAASNGVTVKTARGEIQVMTAGAFGDRYSVAPPDIARGARLAALRFVVRDVVAVKSSLEQAKIPAVTAGGAIVVGPQDAMGAVLVFAR